MQKGIIAKLTDRGYGFIKYDGSNKELFFHSKELNGVEYDDLKEGEEVEFEIGDGPKGPNAVKVTRV